MSFEEQIEPGDSIQGRSFQNCGRWATVLERSGNRIKIRLHLTGAEFWDTTKSWRRVDLEEQLA